MEFQRHTVRKQLVELELSKNLDNNVIQNKIAQILQKDVLPLLDRYFSTFSLPENTDQIDRLVLDLGVVRLNDLETRFPEKIAALLMEQLPRLCNDSAAIQLINPESRKFEGTPAGRESQSGDAASATGKTNESETVLFASETIEFGTAGNSGSASQSADRENGMYDTDSVTDRMNSFGDEHLSLKEAGKKNVSAPDSPDFPRTGLLPENHSPDKNLAVPSGISDPESEFPIGEEVFPGGNNPEGNSVLFQPYSAQKQLDLLSYFLQTGLFPWWVGDTSFERLENALDQLFVQQPAALRNTVFRWLEFAVVRKRMVAAFPEETLFRFVQLFMQEKTTATEESVVRKIRALLEQAFFPSTLRNLFWEEWLKVVYFRKQGVVYRPERLLNDLADLKFTGIFSPRMTEKESENLSLTFKQQQLELIENLVQLFHLPGEKESVHSITDGLSEEKETADLYEELKIVMKETIPNATVTGDKTSEPFGSEVLREREFPSKPEVDAFSESDKIYLNNAGLVLLWPFLQRFFENAGLYTEEGFVDESAVERAAWLLQYIVLGEEARLFEPQLPLNKLLTGLEPEAPVSRPEPISGEESEMINALLEAVTGHVPAWKNLSADSFRRAYLQREGALSARDGQWLLQVKRETYDILLEKVPWSFQIVRLPWMKHILIVEW